MGPAASPGKVFVSHCSLDKPAVNKLVDALRKRGIDVWYDADEIAAGEDVVAKINDALASCNVALVVFSVNFGQGPWVSQELSALLQLRTEGNLVLIPVTLGKGVKLPALVKPLAPVSINDIDKIVKVIRGGPPPSPPPPPLPSQPPPPVPPGPSQDELIGRGRELHQVLWVLRPSRDAEDARRTLDGLHKCSALALVGLGGVGKSTIAGRAMGQLAEDGFLIASHVGSWDLGAIARAVGNALRDSAAREWQSRGKELIDPKLGDVRRLHLLAKTLTDAPLLLVLDDFERNLSRNGAAFLHPRMRKYLDDLIKHAERGRLLITCRFPLPGFKQLDTISIGPLSDADVRKLVLRLPGLRDADPAELPTALRTIGNHPRMLELLEALVRGGEGWIEHVTAKLDELGAQCGIDAPGAAGDLGEALRQSLVVGARDVSLSELLDSARQRGLAEILLQAAVSNLPVHAAGIAHMLADRRPAPDAVARVEQALRQLEAMSLVVRIPDGIDRHAAGAERALPAGPGSTGARRRGGAAWVHRWTAEVLARCQPDDEQRTRWARAGRYRRWRASVKTLDIEDRVEAARCFLRAQAWDDAAADSETVISAYRHRHEAISIVAFIAEVLRVLPGDHCLVLLLHDERGDAHLALQQFEQAREAYEAALEIRKQLADNQPDFAIFQRDLAVSYIKLGDVLLAMGREAEAHEAYGKALAILERLAGNDPARVDFELDLSVLDEHIGHVFRPVLEKPHTILVTAGLFDEQYDIGEPERPDFERDLPISSFKRSDLFEDLGSVDDARKAHVVATDIYHLAHFVEHTRSLCRGLMRKAYAAASTYRTVQPWSRRRRVLRVLLARPRESVLYHGYPGRDDDAQKTYAAAVAVGVRLTPNEPERADYQRDFAVSSFKMDDLFRALGQGLGNDRRTYATALSIIERLVSKEPERADFQRDLAVSSSRIGDLLRDLGHGGDACKAYGAALAILERLVSKQPERADFQRDLAVSYSKMGNLLRDLGHGDNARIAYGAALATFERLAVNEPERADLQRDLAVSYSESAGLFRDAGKRRAARKAYAVALAILQRLAADEPERADLQRDLAISRNRLGDLFRDLGQGEDARKEYPTGLGILERLAASQPERADFRRDLSISHNRTGDLFVAMGQGNDAREAYAAALEIRKRLVDAEPERTDFQRDLSISHNRTGDLFVAMGQGDEAREAYTVALAIRERLAANEPERAAFQHDLVISYNKFGFLLSALGQGDDAYKAYAAALAIRERLAANEPERADFQCDLEISYEHVAAFAELDDVERASSDSSPNPPLS